MQLPVLILALILFSTAADAVPLELSFAGQLTDDAGAPIVDMSAGAPAGTVGALRFTFWTASSGGSQRPVTLLSSPSGPALTIAGTYPASCDVPFTPSCLSVTLNASGVFQAGFFLSAADFHTLFPDSAASPWIQTELVYVSTSTGAVTAAASPVPFRQKFTVAPYCLKVPVDGTTQTYNASGQLTIATGSITGTHLAAGSVGASELASGIITDSHIASGGLSASGTVKGSAITGTIANGTSLNTTGSVTAGAGTFSSLSVGSAAVPSGNGTSGYIPKWTGTSTIAKSVIYDSGTSIGIGKTSPATALDVNGTVTATTLAGNLNALYLTGTVSNSQLATITTAGKVSGDAITTGTIGGSTSMNTTGSINAGDTILDSLYVGKAYTNTPSALSVYAEPAIAANKTGTYSSAALTGAPKVTISSGVDYQGNIIAVNAQAIRNQPTDTGKVNTVTGLYDAYGNNGSAPGLTSNAVGIELQPNHGPAGSVTSSYGVYMRTAKGAAVTNYYGLFAEDAAAKHYLAGRLGIGTTSPGAQLDIQSSGPTWTTWGWGKAIELPNANAIKWSPNAAGWHHGIGQTTTGLNFFRASADTTSVPPIVDMQIDSNGLVGIGTTGARAPLEISSSNTTVTNMLLANTTSPLTWNFQHGGSGLSGRVGNLEILRYGTITGLTITPSGSVGINNVFPSTSLDVPQNGAVKVGNAYLSSGTGAAYYGSLSTNTWYNGTSWFASGMAGAMVQLENQNIKFNTHNGAGNVTNIAYFSPVGNLFIAGCLNAAGTVFGPCASDVRLKKNIIPITGSLDKISRLNPVHFDWRKDEFPERDLKGDRQTGFIAQEMEKIYPELVRTDEDGFKRVTYGTELVIETLQAVRELRREKDAELLALREKNQELEDRLDTLTALICAERPGAAPCRRK